MSLSYEARRVVAVEIDLYRDSTAETDVLRLCNIGPLFSSKRPDQNYIPCLLSPIEFGTAIAIETYGQPMRALASENTIEFALDSRVSEAVFSDDFHWVGQEFRVYEGQPTPRSFVDDLELIFRGRIVDINHNTIRASVKISDSSTALDVPLISDYYPDTALPAIVAKPKPQIWGKVFNIEPVLEDAVNLIYRVSRTPVLDITEVRVGGFPWTEVSTPLPGDAEWYGDVIAGTIRLGSGTNGGEVRADVIGEPLRGIGELITKICGMLGAPVDVDALINLDTEHAFEVGLYAKDPINAQEVIDDITTGAGIWWGRTTHDLTTAGFVEPPTNRPDISIILNENNIVSLSLNQSIPPAWRIRTEYERHWQPSTQFFDAATPEVRQYWSSNGLLVSIENPRLLAAEPRAYDVPAMRSIVANSGDAETINRLLMEAWGVRRQVLDVVANIDPVEIALYHTIAVDYMMFHKNFRIMSAIQSVGGGSAQLQLWG